MDVECSVPPRLSEEDYAREIILAAYHRDAARVASVLRLCGPKATAEMSLSRAAAVQLLGQDVYLGSHSWSTQEGFPVMYFAGERTRASRSAIGSTTIAEPIGSCSVSQTLAAWTA